MAAPADAGAVAGVPLAKYAAVIAAVAEPFPLADVLAVEDLDAARWTEADLGWTQRLAEDPALLARYEAALSAAEDRIARKVDPLDDDLRAWIAFLAAYAASPGDLLSRHGLGLNDLSRLRRRWQRRMKDDPALEKRAADLVKKGSGTLPALRPSKPSLPRSGVPTLAHGSPDGAAAPTTEPPPLPPMPLERYAALTAALSLTPRPAVLARFGLTTAELATLDASFRAWFTRDPTARKDFTRLRAHHAVRATLSGAPPAKPATPPAPAAAAVELEDPETEATEQDLVPVHSLPFRVTPSREYLAALERIAAEPGAGSDGETIVLGGAPRRAPEEVPSPDAPDDEETARTAEPAGGTGEVDAEPLDAEPNDEPGAPVDEDTHTTIMTDAPPLPGPLPFVPNESLDESERVTTIMSTRLLKPTADQPITAAKDGSITFTGKSSNPKKPALPFVPTGKAPPPAAPAPEDEAAASRAPMLSLEQHASLCVELAVDAAHAGEVLARYQLTPEEKVRADEHYRRVVTQDPTLRAAWNRAFEVYRAWFASRPRG